MRIQSKIGAAVCLIAIGTLPAITFGQRVSPASYGGMQPNVQQAGFQAQGQQEQIRPISYEFGGGACQGGCDSCTGCGSGCGNGCNCGCGCGGGFYAIYESVIVQPFFTRNTAYLLSDPPPLNDGYQEVPFDWDFSYSPRIEFGVLVDRGLGGRVRYWYFDDETALNATDANGDIFSAFGEDSITDIAIDNATAALFTHSLRMHVLDIEAAVQKSNLLYSGGFRYAQMEQLYTGTETAPGTDAFSSGHDFEGWGLTVAAEARGPSYGGISVFAKVRGSYLYGTSNFFATNSANTALLVNDNNDDLISVGEIQIGLDSRFDLESGATMFLTVAAEGQYWNNAGTGAPANNAPFDEGNYQNARPQDADLGFFGLNFGTGLIY